MKEQVLKRVFSQNLEIEPSNDLYAKVVYSVKKEQIKRLFCTFVVTSFGVVCSSVLGVAVFWKLTLDIYSSGFLDFLREFGGDSITMGFYYKSFVFALLESFPFFTAGGILFILIIFLESMRYFIKYFTLMKNVVILHTYEK